MASVTTNYGFDVPTSSDLVKNGATQIALLGQDIDTFLFRPFTRNVVLNSSMNIWQRGTSGTNNSFVSGAAGCNADRWQNYLGGGAITVSRQTTNDTTNLPNIQYCARVQRNSGQTAAGAFYHSQSIETVNSIPYAGKQVTVSYYARAGANFSAASSILVGQLLSGTGTDQNVLSGLTGSATVATANATLTTTWQRFTFTGTVVSTATQLALNFYYTTVGTAGANDYFEITGVMLEVGSQASPYCPAGSSYATELAACQRYYEKSYDSTTAPATNTVVGLYSIGASSDGSGFQRIPIKFAVAKRNTSYSVAVYQAGGTSGSWATIRVAGSGTGSVAAEYQSTNNMELYLQTSVTWVVCVGQGHWVVDNEL